MDKRWIGRVFVENNTFNVQNWKIKYKIYYILKSEIIIEIRYKLGNFGIKNVKFD